MIDYTRSDVATDSEADERLRDDSPLLGEGIDGGNWQSSAEWTRPDPLRAARFPLLPRDRRGNHVALSVGIYDSRAAAEAANTAAAHWVQKNLPGLVGAVEVTMGEVLASSAERV